MSLGPYKKNPNHQNHQNQQNHQNHQNHSMNQKNGSNNTSMPGTSAKSKPNDGKSDDNNPPKRKPFSMVRTAFTTFRFNNDSILDFSCYNYSCTQG